MIAVQEPGPEVDLPTHGPTRRGVAPEDQALPGSLKQVRSAIGCDLTSRKDGPQVRDVAMLVLWIVDILHPLPQLAVLSYPVWRDASPHFGQLRAQVAINPENFGGR